LFLLFGSTYLEVVSDVNENVSEATFVLKGHRSIVNHVRYSPSNRIISSCGVEKIIKVWSSLPIPSSYDKPRIRVKKTLLSELSFDEGVAVDDTAEDLNMLTISINWIICLECKHTIQMRKQASVLLLIYKEFC
ncbi:WD domain, G-beta repeat protein, partial [Cooperia oncophora]